VLRGSSFSYVWCWLSAGIDTVFAAFLAWHLSSLEKRDSSAISALGFVSCAMQIAQVALSRLFLPRRRSCSAVVLAPAAWRVRAVARA
jgi:hypothetical protein